MVPVIIILSVSAALLIGLLLHGWFIAPKKHKALIERYAKSHRWVVRAISRNPGGPGSFAERNDTIYRVEFIDEHKRFRMKHCKIAAFSNAVYWN